MPLYEYKCVNCGVVWDEFHSMKDVPEAVVRYEKCEPATGHGSMTAPHVGKRHYSPRSIPNFTEDRLRFWKGPLGNGYSTALGAPMPDNRADLARMEREKGIEFLSPSSIPREWEDAVAYRKHVDEGGERLEDPASFYDVSGFANADTRPEYMKTRETQ